MRSFGTMGMQKFTKVSYQGAGVYYANLDGLRGYAVLSVVGYHLFGLPGGWVGVDLFFVLSGFLITGKLLQLTGSGRSLKEFYLRRAVRIFPLYYVTLILYFGITVFYGLHTWQQSLPFLFFYQNFSFGFAGSFGMEIAGGLKHLWSLAVEEHFYLLFPVSVLLLKRPSLTRLLIVLILVSILTRIWLTLNGYIVASFVITPCRLDGFSVGALLALQLRDGAKLYWWILYSVAGAVIGMVMITSDQFSRLYLFGGISVLAIGSSVLIMFALTKDRIVKAILGNKLIVHLGKLSYGIYVIHYVLQFLAGRAIPEIIPQAGAETITTSVLVSIATYFLSSLSFRYFEKPLLTWGKRKEA